MIVLLLLLGTVLWRIAVTDVRERLVYSLDLIVLAVLRVGALVAAYVGTALGLGQWLEGTAPVAGAAYVVLALPASKWGFTSLGTSVVCAAVVMLCVGGIAAVASRVARKSLLGAGDVKLYGVCCLFLDAAGMAAFVWLSVLIGVAMALWALVVRKSHTFPFAPALAVGCWCAVAGSWCSLW